MVVHAGVSASAVYFERGGSDAMNLLVLGGVEIVAERVDFHFDSFLQFLFLVRLVDAQFEPDEVLKELDEVAAALHEAGPLADLTRCPHIHPMKAFECL